MSTTYSNTTADKAMGVIPPNANAKTDGKLHTALAHLGLAAVDSAQLSDSALTLVERPVMGLLLLRAGTAADALGEALKSVCGLSLSERLQSAQSEAFCIRWMSPDCWLLSCPLLQAASTAQALRERVAGHIAIVDVSGGFSVLELNGSHARSVLAKSTGYDTHPDHFFAGKVVNTTFAKVQLTLRAIHISDSHGRYELIVRRSYSDYLHLWLRRAGAEYGLQVFAAGI